MLQRFLVVCLLLGMIVPANAQSNNRSLRFFGTGSGGIDRVTIPLIGKSINVRRNFTIEFWVRTSTGNDSGSCTTGHDAWINGNIIIDRDVYGAGDKGDYGVSLYGGRIAFGVNRGSTGETICSNIDVDDGLWHHVAAQRSAKTGQMTIFIDGELTASGTGPTGAVHYNEARVTFHRSDKFLVLGAEKHDVGAAYPSFSGWLDELRISSIIRYSGSFAPRTKRFNPDSWTIALYHFDEGTGTRVFDATGQNKGKLRVGGASNGPQWSTESPW